MLQTFIAPAEQSSTHATQNILLKQSTLLDKQLKEIMKLSSSRKVPHSHFESNSADGISFDTSQHPISQDPTTKQEHSNHPSAPPASAAPTAPPTLLTIQASYQSNPLYINQDTMILNLMSNLSKPNGLKKAPQPRFGYHKSLVSSHPSRIITPCKTKINYDATRDGPNATLFSVLHNKLSESYRTMLCLNCGFTTGTQILHFIKHATKKLRGNKANETQNVSDFYRSVWSPNDEDLDKFNARFNTLYNSVLETNDPNFTFDSVKDTRIRAITS